MESYENSPVLRLLDANANRAREGLRVIEDYARFVLDDDKLCQRLKDLRHELSQAVDPIAQRAIAHRDTPGDVGTSIQAHQPMPRQNLADVVTAAGKRLGEALRVLEEFAKTSTPAAAEKIAACRYRFYDIEQAIARSLHPGDQFAAVRLYVLISQNACPKPWLQTAEQAILGGADCLQLREKDLEGGEFLSRAIQLVQLCRRHGVLCIINDRPDIALLAGADGVHVGQEDLPAAQVRQLVGPDKIVGVSTHKLEQARQAVLDGANYLGVGPVFPSQTKPRDFLASLPYVRQVAAAIVLPAVAISGISEANVDEVIAAGMRRVAVASAVTAADNVRLAAEKIKAKLQVPVAGDKDV